MLSHDDNDFNKQRRNLILVSAIILAKSYLGIDYSKLEFIAGITVENPEGFRVVLWILWFYFFIRYFNKFFETESTFKTPLFKIRDDFIKNICAKLYTRTQTPERKENLSVQTIQRKIFTLENKVNINYNHADGKPDDEIYIFRPLKTISLYLRGLLHYIFKTHYFFEYYFPIFFSLLPLWTLLP